jgi:hypothetical protein
LDDSVPTMLPTIGVRCPEYETVAVRNIEVDVIEQNVLGHQFAYTGRPVRVGLPQGYDQRSVKEIESFHDIEGGSRHLEIQAQ